MRFAPRMTTAAALVAVTIVVFAAGSTPVAAQSVDQALAARHEAAKKEGKLTLYGVDTAELLQQLGDAFKKRFPGVAFDFFRSDSATMYQRLEAEAAAGRHVADAIMLTADRSETMEGKSELLKIDSPVAAIYPAGIQPTSGYWYNYGLNVTAFAYNTDLVKASEAPKTWSDLLDPKWKGKIGMQDPKSGAGGAYAWVARMHKVLGEEKWHPFMDAMGKQIARYGQYLPVREALVSGEIAIQLAAYPDFTEPLKLKGAKIDWATPEPTFFVGLTIQANAKAPNPNAAKLFVDFMLTDEGQKIIADAGKIPARPESRPGGFVRLNAAKMEPMDPNRLYGAREKTWFDGNIQKYFASGR